MAATVPAIAAVAAVVVVVVVSGAVAVLVVVTAVASTLACSAVRNAPTPSPLIYKCGEIKDKISC